MQRCSRRNTVILPRTHGNIGTSSCIRVRKEATKQPNGSRQRWIHRYISIFPIKPSSIFTYSSLHVCSLRPTFKLCESVQKLWASSTAVKVIKTVNTRLFVIWHFERSFRQLPTWKSFAVKCDCNLSSFKPFLDWIRKHLCDLFNVRKKWNIFHGVPY